MPGAAPPGLISPSAAPFQDLRWLNDAPPLFAPYLVGVNTTIGSVNPVTIPVQNPTNPGDAIVVNATSSNGGALPVSCTDTQNNTYSMTSTNPGNKVCAQWVAQNTAPLGNTDTITATFASTTGTKQAIAISCPLPAVTLTTSSGTGTFLTFEMASAVGSGGGVLNALPVPAGAAVRHAVLAIAASYNGSGAGAAQFPQGWTVIKTVGGSGGQDFTVIAYKRITNIASAAPVITTWQGAANISLQYVTLIPETRFAPNQPNPLAPPGRTSPGAWQFQPGFNAPGTARFSNATVGGSASAAAVATATGAPIQIAGGEADALGAASAAAAQVVAGQADGLCGVSATATQVAAGEAEADAAAAVSASVTSFADGEAAGRGSATAAATLGASGNPAGLTTAASLVAQRVAASALGVTAAAANAFSAGSVIAGAAGAASGLGTLIKEVRPPSVLGGAASAAGRGGSASASSLAGSATVQGLGGRVS